MYIHTHTDAHAQRVAAAIDLQADSTFFVQEGGYTYTHTHTSCFGCVGSERGEEKKQQQQQIFLVVRQETVCDINMCVYVCMCVCVCACTNVLIIVRAWIIVQTHSLLPLTHHTHTYTHTQVHAT